MASNKLFTHFINDNTYQFKMDARLFVFRKLCVWNVRSCQALRHVILIWMVRYRTITLVDESKTLVVSYLFCEELILSKLQKYRENWLNTISQHQHNKSYNIGTGMNKKALIFQVAKVFYFLIFYGLYIGGGLFCCWWIGQIAFKICVA